MRTCEACKGTTYDEGGEPCDPCAGSGLVGHPADEATAMTKHSPGPWRVGRKVKRTIYNAHDDLIGTMDTPALALRAVSAVNDIEEALSLLREEVGEDECNCPWSGCWHRRALAVLAKHPTSIWGVEAQDET